MAEEDSTDHGLLELKSEEELKEQMDEVGIQFRYGCYMDKIPMACHSLGQWLESYKRDLSKATAQFKHTCDNHLFGESCLKYANRRLNSIGCEKSTEVALEYYLKGCEKADHTRCCVAAGQLLESGRTSKGADFPSAFKFFSLACERGYLGGCTRAANLALQGKGFPQKDLATALGLYKKACDGDDFRACVNLSVMYKRGDGVEVDLTKSEEYKEKAKALRKRGVPSTEFRPPSAEMIYNINRES